jgi:hypothetical protein
MGKAILDGGETGRKSSGSCERRALEIGAHGGNFNIAVGKAAMSVGIIAAAASLAARSSIGSGTNWCHRRPLGGETQMFAGA